MAMLSRALNRRLFSAGPAAATKVRRGHEIDVSKVVPLLLDCGAIQPDEAGSFEVQQFSHGQSNPTYNLQFGSGKQLVLRKQPPGKLLRGAHAIDREYTVMSALAKHTDVPVPRTHLLVEDAEVIGTPFYVCDFVQGRLFLDAAIKDAPSPQERAALYGAFLRTIAAMHSVDVTAAGLGEYGRFGGYIPRQIKVWTTQYRAAETHPIPSMEKLIAWLPEALPPDDDLTTLVHGDLRVDNMIFQPDAATVAAVLDWELSTLGHPGTDLALATIPYVAPSAFPPAFNGLSPKALASSALGAPSEQQFVDEYVEATGLSSVRTHMDYHRAFVCFRMASILQGVYKRSLSGQASAANAEAVGLLASGIADFGVGLADKYTTQPGRLDAAAGIGSAFFAARRAADRRPPAAAAAAGVSREEEMKELRGRVRRFVDERIIPLEASVLGHSYEAADRWTYIPEAKEQLKEDAKAEGLWNLFLPDVSGLTNAEYAGIAEETGRCLLAPEAFNCGAPDTGNMEVLHMFGTEEQKAMWLEPLLDGRIRSCFAMTEPAVASSDATNMEATVREVGDELILNGRKWWISGSADPRTKICIFMGRVEASGVEDRPRHQRHSMVLVPMDTPGVKVVRPLRACGFDDAPHGHCEMDFEEVRVPRDNLILGSGRGFEIAQARLGPGRIHHCMRLIGMAERGLELACARAQQRTAFGKPLAAQGVVQQQIAISRCEIDQARLLTLHAAGMIDDVGAKGARKEIAMIKAVAPLMAQTVLDRCQQIHGGLGLSNDTPLAHFFMWARSLRLADGPDEVHLASIAKQELKTSGGRR